MDELLIECLCRHMAYGCGWRMLNVGEWISSCIRHTGVDAILYDMICMVFIAF